MAEKKEGRRQRTRGGHPSASLPGTAVKELDWRVITVAVHTKKEVGKGLAARILKEAGP